MLVSKCSFICVFVPHALLISWIWICIFILHLCRACWLLNILSGHVKCERNRAQNVQLWPSACSLSTLTPSLSLTHLQARSLIFVTILPPTRSSPLPAPLHCYTWHNGPIIVPFCLSVTSAHSALIQNVFVLGHHDKITSTWMSNIVCFWMTVRVNPVMQYTCYITLAHP